MTNIAKSIGLGLGAAFDGIILFIGAGLISAGAWLIYHPAGLLAAGVLMIAGIVLHGLGRAR